MYDGYSQLSFLAAFFGVLHVSHELDNPDIRHQKAGRDDGSFIRADVVKSINNTIDPSTVCSDVTAKGQRCQETKAGYPTEPHGHIVARL